MPVLLLNKVRRLLDNDARYRSVDEDTNIINTYPSKYLLDTSINISHWGFPKGIVDVKDKTLQVDDIKRDIANVINDYLLKFYAAIASDEIIVKWIDDHAVTKVDGAVPVTDDLQKQDVNQLQDFESLSNTLFLS